MTPLLAFLAALGQAADADGLPRPAPGWKVSLVARAPDLRFPSAVACAPDGRVFVAEDLSDQVGPVDRPVNRVRCVHPGGKITLFAEGLHAVFGLAYLEGRLYVQHAPFLSVFRDAGEEGRDRRDLLDCTLPRPWEPNRMNEHVPSNLRLGMDGRFYASCGSKGLFGTVGTDGRPFQMRMGGIWTFRPDGTRLEVLAEGTRNTLDLALNEFDDAFLADNNCHMAVWPSGLFHARDGSYFGYPYHYKPHRPPAQPPIADLGYGACTGVLAVTEGVLPAEFDNDLVFADWGRSELVRLRMVRKGATWDLVRREAILSGGLEFRPIALDTAPDGSGFYVADWNHPGGRAGRDVGRLLRVEWTGPSRARQVPGWYLRAAAGEEPGVPAGELLAGLGHADRRIRIAAQRALVRAGQAAVPGLEAVLSDRARSSRARMHALWALHEQAAGPGARRAALEDPDPVLKSQAARAFVLSPDPAATSALLRLAADPEPFVRLQAVTALGRSGDLRAVPVLLDVLAGEDAFLAAAAIDALRRIGRAEAAVWPAIVRTLGNPRSQVRDRAALVFRDLHDAGAAGALADPGLEPPARGEALRLLAGLYRRAPPWDGTWWRRGPYGWTEDDRKGEARIDATETWEASPGILETLRRGLESPDAGTRAAAAEGIGRAGDDASIPGLRSLLARDPDPGVRSCALRSLSLLKDLPSIAGVLADPAGPGSLVREAAEAAGRSGSAEFVPALAKLLERPASGADLVAVIEGLAALGGREAAPAISRHLAHPEAGVVMAALGALGRLGAAGPLVQALEKTEDAGLRSASIRALGPLRSKEAVPALLKAWLDPATREEALDALTLVPDPRARDAYVSGLQARSTNLRGRCRAALKAIGTDAPAGPPRPDRGVYARFAAEQAGDAERGREIFHGAQGAGCVKCHRAGGLPGGDVGPDLSGAGAKYSRAVLAESVLFPSRQITEGFRQVLLSTRAGEVLSGALRGEDAGELTLVDAEARRIKVRKAEILERRESELSLMPEGVEAGLTLQEFSDLVSYLESLKDPRPR